jgi:hypothetical protein
MSGVFQYRGTGAAGDVGAETYVHALLQHAAQWKHGIGEIDVRQWAMRDSHARVENRCDIGPIDEVSVRKDGAPRQ